MQPTSDLLVTLAGEIYVKSERTRRWFHRRIADNLGAALEAAGTADAGVSWLDSGRLVLSPASDRAAEAAARVFGVHRVERARRLAWSCLADLVVGAADLARPRVTGRTFAVRPRRHGHHDWRSTDLARDLGTALLDVSAGVNLDEPEVEVGVLVVDDQAWLVGEPVDGPGGLPLGTQESCLAMLSGGFDSAVAAWMLMRRGCPVDFLHIRLECAQSDHALAVAHDLWRRWGAGTRAVAWEVDLSDAADMLRDRVPARLRQVVLKQLMYEAAGRVAGTADLPAVVTGESVGQVSSQTLRHLVEIDRCCPLPVLRPLAGLDKEEIVDRARQIGTAELSARAREVCDLSGGAPVAVGAHRDTLDRARERLPDDLVAEAVERRRVIALADWGPGVEPQPVTERVPA